MTVTWKISQDGTTRGDVVVDSTGRPVEIEGTEKLSQDVRQGLTQATDVEGFGSDLDAIVGRTANEFVIRADISSRVRSSVRAIQDAQDRFHLVDRTSKERLAGITRLRVGLLQRGTEFDRTTFTFRLDVKSVFGVTTPIGGQLVVSR